jgi:ABC-2 type transport system ATP-binding protein
MSRTPPTIQLAAVSKWYGEVIGLNEVNAEFTPGVSGLLGPNGAGKSTMLKLIAGMLRPNLGSVRVCGRDPFTDRGVMRRVGLVPEVDAAYPKAGVLDVVTYLTRLQGYPAREARDRARNALEHVGLGKVLDRSVAGFSKGMKQRANLAQALAHDADVLVLDEPLNGLDPTGRREYIDVIRRLGDEGRCVLVSSHVLHEVEAVARELLFIYSGRVLAEGTAREIRAELSDHPLIIEIRTPEPQRLGANVIELDGVLRVEIGEGVLSVQTRQPNDVFDRVADLGAREEIPIDAIIPADEDLESVFRYLTT